jgi:hypothetical protein
MPGTGVCLGTLAHLAEQLLGLLEISVRDGYRLRRLHGRTLCGGDVQRFGERLRNRCSHCDTERGGGDHRCRLALRNTWYRLAYQCSLLYGWGVTQCWKLLRDAGKGERCESEL